jgi:aspartate aminotransferase
MCDKILKETGVALLPGSDFGFSKERMLTRLSFTDFDGETFMKKYKKDNSLNNELIKNLAPNVVEGVERLKKWSESL